MRSRIVAALALFLALPFAPASGWNDAGHTSVALIAAAHLPKATKARVLALLRKHPSAEAWAAADDAALLSRAANWPDEIRREDHPLHAEHRLEDHFINLPFAVPADQTLTEEQSLAGQLAKPNIVRRLKSCVAALKDPLVEAPVRARELSWLLHLVGDIHQPLHCAARISKRFPDGDRGGNWALVAPAAREVKPSELEDPPRLPNLHAFWDGLPGADAGEGAPDRKADVKTFAPEAWAWESWRLAVSIAYDKGELEALAAPEALASLKTGKPVTIPALPAGYEEKARGVARRQIALAGRRLASVLVEIFGE